MIGNEWLKQGFEPRTSTVLCTKTLGSNPSIRHLTYAKREASTSKQMHGFEPWPSLFTKPNSLFNEAPLVDYFNLIFFQKFFQRDKKSLRSNLFCFGHQPSFSLPRNLFQKVFVSEIVTSCNKLQRAIDIYKNDSFDLDLVLASGTSLERLLLGWHPSHKLVKTEVSYYTPIC